MNLTIRTLATKAKPFVEIVAGGTTVFTVPTNGVISVANGGTGVGTVAALQALLTNAPVSGITAVANGGTGTNSLSLITVGNATLAATATLATTSVTATNLVGWSQKTNTIIYVASLSLDTNTLILTTTLETNITVYLGQ